MNDRTPRENYGRFSQTTSKVYRLHAPIPRLSSTKLAAFVIRHNAGRKRAGHAINDGTCVHHFVSIALAAYTCSESDKIYRMQHFWYNIVMPCSASFSRFRFFYYFVIGQKYVRKIETSRNWQKTWHHYIVPRMLQPIKFIRL